MSTQKNLITLCIATVFTLGLAACGGGGSDAPVTGVMDGDGSPEPTEPELTPAEQLAAAQSAVADAQALVDSASTSSEIAAAYGALATAQMKLSAAESIPANQIALLAARLEQARIDLQNTQMLAEQRGTVGAALIAAQNLVNGLSAASSDADAAAASAAVAAAQAVLANASALPADDSLHGSVAAVADLLASVDMSRTVYSQRGTVDAALTAAQMAVGGLSNASTDEDVTAARTAVMAAQAELALATALSADDPRHASVMGVYDSLGDAVTARTAHMDTQTINGLITTAQSAVGGLDQVTSSGADVEAARAAMMAVTEAIVASTALTDDEKAALGGMVSMAVTDLEAIDTFRSTADGQLKVAEAALAHAQGLVDDLTPTSTAAQAAEAYGALGEAQAAIHAARALPANVIARLTDSLKTANEDLGDANRLAGERETVGDAIVAATTEIAGLNADSTDADIEAARVLVTAAQTALSETTEMSEDEKAGLRQTIASLGTQIGNVETLQMAAETERMQTEQRNAALTALSMAQAAINGLNDDSPEEMVDAARVLVTAAQTALDAATDLSPAETDGLQMLVTAADLSVTGYETIVAARPDPMVVAAITAAAKTKTTEIKAEADQAADADQGLGGADAANYDLSIERPRSGTEIKITDSGLMGEDDPKFVKQDVDLGAETSMHVREMEADEDDGTVEDEVVVVTTDIAAPRAVAFAKFEDDEGMLTQTLTVRNDDEDVSEDDNPANSLAVDETSETVRGLVKSPAFTAGTAADLKFVSYVEDSDNVADGAQTIDAFEGAGTYNGAMGTYKCILTGGTDCTVTLDAKGMITGMSDGWIFTPDTGATSDQPDYDYLNYGFWLARTKNADGTVKSYDEVETFAGSSLVATGAVDNVDGSATYMGGATGVYVKNVHNPDSTIASATSGLFTADAELTATFGQTMDDSTTDINEVGQIAPNLVNTINGKVYNFEDGDGVSIDGSWTVNLMKGDITVNDGTFLGETTGGGDYNGTFYGATPETESMGDGSTVVAPGSVVGEFDAIFSNGSVAGGFGARKQ